MRERDSWIPPRLLVEVPPRLYPYLEDLLATGLWGTSLPDVCTRLLEAGILEAIHDAVISQRRNGLVPERELEDEA